MKTTLYIIGFSLLVSSGIYSKAINTSNGIDLEGTWNWADDYCEMYDDIPDYSGKWHFTFKKTGEKTGEKLEFEKSYGKDNCKGEITETALVFKSTYTIGKNVKNDIWELDVVKDGKTSYVAIKYGERDGKKYYNQSDYYIGDKFCGDTPGNRCFIFQDIRELAPE